MAKSAEAYILEAESILQAMAMDLQSLDRTLSGCRHRSLGDAGTAVAGEIVLGGICRSLTRQVKSLEGLRAGLRGLVPPPHPDEQTEAQWYPIELGKP